MTFESLTRKKKTSMCFPLWTRPGLYVLMWVHVLPADVEEKPARRAWWKDEMACVNSVRQGLVSSDFCPQVTAVSWSFQGLESEAANEGNHPACLCTCGQRDTVTENKRSQLTVRGKPVGCVRPNCVSPATYTIYSIRVWLMWRDSQDPQRQGGTWDENMCV